MVVVVKEARSWSRRGYLAWVLVCARTTERLLGFGILWMKGYRDCKGKGTRWWGVSGLIRSQGLGEWAKGNMPRVR